MAQKNIMSNLLKSKFVLGFVAVAVMLVGVNFASASDCSLGTSTLKYGQRSAAVTCLQTSLNVTPATGYFGKLTLAAVKAFQTNHALTADGLVGKGTKAAITTGSTGTTTGTTTSDLCPNGMTLASNCVTAPNGTVVSTGPLSVTLSTDNPAAGTIIVGQATADLAHFNFTGNGTLSAITLQRSGISDQSTLSNVYLYDGVTRLTDGYSFNNAGVLTMSGLNIPVSGSKVLSVRADVWSSFVSNVQQNSAYSIAVALTSYTVTGGTANVVSLKGNDMYVASGTSLGSATFNGLNGVSGTPKVNPGVVSYPLWSAPMNIGTRSLLMKSISFRVIGSAPTDAIANAKLYKDGVAVGNAGTMVTINGSTYVAFDMSAAPVELTTGSHTLDLRADIQKGSARTIQISLQQASDLMIYDSQIGVNVAAGVSSVTWSQATTAASIEINQGTVSVAIDPTFQSMTKITGGASNVTIAKFKLHAYGEDVKMNTLNFLPFTSTGNGLQNVTAYFNGSQVGSQVANWSAAGVVALTPGSQMIVPAGVDSYLEIKADLRTTASVNYTSGTLSASLQASSGEGMTSHNSVALAATTGNTLTIQTGLLAVGSNSNYSSQVMNSNTQNVKVGSYTLQNQSTSESVRVTSMRVTTTFGLPTYTSGTTTVGTSAIVTSSNVGMSIGDVLNIAGGTVGTITAVNANGTGVTATWTAGSTQASASAVITDTSKTASALVYLSNLRTTETSGNGATPMQPTGTDTFSVDFTLAPGAVKTIDVMADLGAANFGTVLTKLAVQGIGASSNVQVFSNGAASLTYVTGQTITLATGSISAPVIVSSSSTAAQFVAAAGAGATNAAKSTFKFVASNGVATISEMKFRSLGPVTAVTIGGQTGSVVGAAGATGAGVANVDITGLNLTVPNGGNGVNFDALISYGPIGTGATASQTAATIELVDVIFTIGGQPSEACIADFGTCATVMTHGATNTSASMVLVGSKPTLTVATTSNAGLLVGENHLMDLTVAADSKGDISLNSIKFNVATSSTAGAFHGPAASVTTSTRLAVGSTTITNATCTTDANTVTSGTLTCAFSGGYVIPAGTPVVFSLYGTTTGAIGAVGTSSITTSLSTADTFSWNDDAGAASGTAITTANLTNLYNYPTGTWSIHN